MLREVRKVMGQRTRAGRQVWPQGGSRLADRPGSIERFSLEKAEHPPLPTRPKPCGVTVEIFTVELN